MECDKERWCACVEREHVTKLCVKDCVCDKVVRERWCGERWCVTKLCVKDGVVKDGVRQSCV